MRRTEKGFTLMELMVVIVIVAILAAVAVPLYINYVKDAQRTEAKGAIGAVITSEQTHFQRYGEYLAYTDGLFKAPPAADKDRLDCDIRDAQANWTFTVTTPTSVTDGFVVTAVGVATGPAVGLTVTFTLSRGTPPADPWTES
jgi:type IV pilus assembly protein PilE